MKKSIKIIVAILIILMLMLATKSYAALECKQGGTKDTKSQEAAFQLCYDMRDPTSSLGNNSLDSHLMLNKDFGAYAYLGMSAYGTNGAKTAYSNVGNFTTPNYTGISNVIYSELTAGIYLPTGLTSTVVQKYGRSKYTEIFEENPNLESTKGMAIIETKGWYSAVQNKDYGGESTLVIYRNYYNSEGYNWGIRAYAYNNGGESDTKTNYRPVIWNQ